MTSTKYRTLSTNEIMYVLNHAPYCLLGLADSRETLIPKNVKPYIVPMDYIYPQPGIFVLRSYNDTGKKMRILNNNSNVVLEFNYRIHEAILSVIVTGTAEVIKLDPHNVSPLYEIRVTVDSMTGRKYYIHRHH